MRIALFGYEGQLLREAALSGLARLGHDIVSQIPSGWSVGQALRDIDGVVTCGLRSACGDAARHYHSHGKPVAIIDWPHIRTSGQFRVTPPDLSYLPTGKVDGDRLEALGITLGTRKRVKAQGVMVIGQAHGDPTHGAMSQVEFSAWAEGVTKTVRSLSDSKIIWRPHPNDVYNITGADEFSDPREETLADAMKRVWLVVTYSSTGGLEALIAGLPVIAQGSPVYKSLAGSFDDFKSVSAPTKVRLTHLLEKIAYTQWDASEIATGQPFEPFFGSGFEARVAPNVKAVKTDSGGGDHGSNRGRDRKRIS